MTRNTTHGRSRPRLVLLLLAAAILAAAVLAAAWLLPRRLGIDETAVAQVMPSETAVYLEINLLHLQNQAARDLAARLQPAYAAAAVPMNETDPTTLFNILDGILQPAVGLTVSGDVRPWIGAHAGLGILPATVGGHPSWVLAATVRDGAAADQFVQQLAARMQATPTALGHQLAAAPSAARLDNLVLVASDPAALAAATAADGLHLADSRRFQETLDLLPPDRAATLYLHDATENARLLSDFGLDPGVIELLAGVLPTYTAVGLGAHAVEAGVQMDLVGLHEPLTEDQRALLAAQTAVPETDTYLPAETAVYWRGQRLDLIWPQAKESLAGLGYSAADVDEAIELFAGLFGFDPEADLLAALDGEYALALLPAGEGTAVPGLSGVLLARHTDPAALAGQAEGLAAGLARLGAGPAEADEAGIFQVTGADGRPLAAYMPFGETVLVGTDKAGVTAVTQSTIPLTQNPRYQNGWDQLPPGNEPLLFVDIVRLGESGALARRSIPAAYLVLGTHSDEAVSRSTLVLVIEPPGE